MAQGVDVLHRPGLDRERAVGEGRGIGGLPLRLAGRCLCDRSGGVHRFGLHVRGVVLAHALRRHRAVVRSPGVGGSVPIVTKCRDRNSLRVCYFRAGGAVGCQDACGVNGASRSIAGCGSCGRGHCCRDLFGEVAHSSLEDRGGGRIAIGIAAGPVPALQRVLLGRCTEHGDEVRIGGDSRQLRHSGAVLRAAELPTDEGIGVVLVCSLGGRFGSGGGLTGGNRLILPDLGRAVLLEEFDREASSLRPLGVEGDVFGHRVLLEVPGGLEGRVPIPAGEAEALLGRVLRLGQLLSLLHALRLDFGSAIGFKADQHKLRNVVILFPNAAVVERCALGAGAELIAFRVSLAIGIVRLKDGIGAGIGRPLEVAAGDEGRLFGVLVVVLIGVGGGRCSRVDTAADLADPGIDGVVHRVVACRGAVGVDLHARTQFVDHRQIAGVSAAVLDADAVGSDHRVLNTADMGEEVAILVGGRSRCTFGVGRRVEALIQSASVVVNAADLLLGSGADGHRVLAAIDGGDLAQIHQHLIGAAEVVARADQIDHRRVVAGGVDFRVVSVNHRAGGIRAVNGKDIQNVGIKFADAGSAVVEDGGVGGGDRIVGQGPQMAAVIERIGRGAGDGIVIHHFDLGRITAVSRCQIAAVVLRCGELGRARIIADVVPGNIGAVDRVRQHILGAGEAAVCQAVDHAQIAEAPSGVFGQRDSVDAVNHSRDVVKMVFVGGDVIASAGKRLPGQGMARLAAVAVEEHGVALPRSRARGGEVAVAQGADVALVLQQLIAVGAGANEAHAVDALNGAGAVHVADIGLDPFGLCGRVRVAGVGADIIIGGKRAGAGVQQDIVVGREAAAADLADRAAVHHSIVGHSRDGTAVNPADLGSAAII